MDNFEVLELKSEPYQFRENSKWVVDVSVNFNGVVCNTHFFCDTLESANEVRVGVLSPDEMPQPIL